MKKQIWYKGEQIKFTGKSQFLYGADFFEFEYLTGHKKGKTEVMSARQKKQIGQ